VNDPKINEGQVDRDFAAIDEIRWIAWQRNPQDVAALCDRLRVMLMTTDLPKRRRRLYRALIDYYDEVLDERLDAEGMPSRGDLRQSALNYVRDILKSSDPD
jgi:hypothetical protein